MKNLWAPWRIEYILSKKGPECVFCTMPAEDRDRDNLILFRGAECFIIMNLFPYNCGHVMVVPYHHTSTFEGLTDTCMNEMIHLARYSVECVGAVMRPEGFNTGLNIGVAAGAGIKEHIHMHIVPRWVGDSNFMAVVEEVRVVPEHLFATYDKLLPEFRKNAQRAKG